MGQENSKKLIKSCSGWVLPKVYCLLEINIPIGANHDDKRSVQSNLKTAPGSRTTSCRANKKFPQSEVHRPYKKQGLQIPDLYMEQMISQIRTLLRHNGVTQDPAGFRILACCKSIWIESGWSGNLIDIPEACKPLLTDSWVKHIWQECHCHKIRIHSNTKEVEPQCKGNIEIMCIILKQGYHKQELQMINRCSRRASSVVKTIYCVDSTGGLIPLWNILTIWQYRSSFHTR